MVCLPIFCVESVKLLHSEEVPRCGIEGDPCDDSKNWDRHFFSNWDTGIMCHREVEDAVAFRCRLEIDEHPQLHSLAGRCLLRY